MTARPTPVTDPRPVPDGPDDTAGRAGPDDTAGRTGPDDTAALATELARVVAAHPAVVRLDGGAFGAVATYLPGRRLLGVRVGAPGEPVEVGVVLRADRPIPQTVAELREAVAAVRPGPVDVTVADVVVEPPRGAGR